MVGFLDWFSMLEGMGLDFFLYAVFAGMVVGVLAGLFGVGGGILVVPVLTVLFRSIGMNEEILAHTAIGTSLATIFFTSFSSFYTHHLNKAVLWRFVFLLSPGILFGSYLGSLFASQLKSHILLLVFIFFTYFFSIRLILSSRKIHKDKKEDNPLENTNPSPLPYEEQGIGNLIRRSIAGLLIGFSSALVGIGGGVFTSAYLLHLRTPIHLAIGTASAIGFPIAISATLSYIYTGWKDPRLMEYSMGFVYLPALAGIVLGSIPFATLGAKLSHTLDKSKLRFYFGIFLFFMAIFMSYQEYQMVVGKRLHSP